MTGDLAKFEIATKLMGVSPRYRHMDRLEAYFKGLQHDHYLKDWNGMDRPSGGWQDKGAAGQEMWSRDGYHIIEGPKRPTVRYPVAKKIVTTYTNFLFAEGRFPEIRYEGDEATEAWLRNAIADAALPDRCITWRNYGGSQGTAVMTFRFVDGALSFEVWNPKNVEVLEWENRTELKPSKIRIQYVYPAMNPNGTPETESVFDEGLKGYIDHEVWRWFRRDIGADADVLYDNPKMDPKAPVPFFTEVQRVPNPNGKFPGVFVQNISNDFDSDGYSDFEDLTDLLDRIDELASQLDRSIHYSGYPQLVIETLEGHEVQSIRRTPEHAIILTQGEKAYFLQLQGGVHDMIDAQVEKYIKRAMEGAGVIPLDPKELSGRALSAKSLEYIWQPTLAEAGNKRQKYGNRGLCILLDRVVDCAKAMRDSGKLEGSTVTFTHKGELGPTDKLANTRLDWPQYFSATVDDRKAEIDAAQTAELAGYISHETAAQSVAPSFGVRDAKEEQKKIDETPEDVKQERVDKLKSAMRTGRKGPSTATEEGAAGGEQPGGQKKPAGPFRGRP